MFLNQSCATILGGPVTDSQRTKPATGEPQREIKAGFLILDILLGFIPLLVDFGTGAIYKPAKSGNSSKNVESTHDAKAKLEFDVKPSTEEKTELKSEANLTKEASANEGTEEIIIEELED
jgi:hypothetical protein